MSDDKSQDPQTTAKTAAPVDAAPRPAPSDAPAGEQLAGLMANDARSLPSSAPDADAMLAAEQALAAGERALAAAHAQLHADRPRAGRRREFVVRVLLVANLIAMLVVAALPSASAVRPTSAPRTTPMPWAPPDGGALSPRHEPFARALAAAERGNHHEAIAILERYLADVPQMAASRQLNVLDMLAHYAGLAGDGGKAETFAQRAAALGQGPAVPADLLAMARSAIASGDHEVLRRVGMRFLLQQRPIPSWLYRHVVEAQLQLTAGHRDETNDPAERRRLQELQATAARLREQARQDREQGK